MGFFFKNKKKNKEEETVTPVVETTPEVPAKEGMILVREGTGTSNGKHGRSDRGSRGTFKRSWICR